MPYARVSMKDFFISYNEDDQEWAEWIAWTLKGAGYTVVLQTWNFTRGQDFSLDMNRAVAETQTTIAVLSETFLRSDYTAPEWAAAFVQDLRQLERKLMPLLLEHCPLTGVLAEVRSVDLVGLPEDEATALLLEALQARVRLASKPCFPGVVTPTPTFATFAFSVVTVNAEGQKNNWERGQAQYFTEDLGDGVTLDLVAIPGGAFQMGSPAGEGDPSECPQHTVTVKPFLISQYPVTQAQWQSVAALPKVSRNLAADPSEFKGANRPVEQVSWHDAVEFCVRLAKQTRHDYRLPSEAEWEYACRAGTTTPFHFGETIKTNLANYNGTTCYYMPVVPRGLYREQTTDVGGFPPNAFGLHDMHGNVYEWCADHWHDNYQGAPSDGSAWVEGGNPDRRTLRGGSWMCDPLSCSAASRDLFTPDNRYECIGFRVVCSAL